MIVAVDVLERQPERRAAGVRAGGGLVRVERVIQICGRPGGWLGVAAGGGISDACSRTPKSRLLDTVTQNIGSLFAPRVCANGAHRAHEFVSATPALAAASSIGWELPSAFITHTVELRFEYAPLVLLSVDWLNRIHWPSGENDG